MKTALKSCPIEGSEILDAGIAKPSDSLALITLDPARYVAEVYAPFRAKLAAAKIEADAVVIDCSTTAGNAIAIKHRAIFRDDVRLAVEGARTERKAPILMIGKLIDSTANEIKAEAKPYEDRFDNAIKAEAERKEVEKAALILAERQRTDAIQARIQAIQNAPLAMAGKSSAEIMALRDEISAIVISEELYGELIYREQAAAARYNAFNTLEALFDVAYAAEQEAARQLSERLAEDQRRADAAIQLAKDQAELAEAQRVAREGVARLAAEQKAEQAERDRIAAGVKAQLEAQAAKIEADRKAVEADQARIAADLKAAQEKFNAEVRAHAELVAAQQAAADARDAAALKAKEDAAHAVSSHAEALDDNAAFDAARSGPGVLVVHLDIEPSAESVAEQLARCKVTAEAMKTNGRRLTQRDGDLDAADAQGDAPQLEAGICWSVDDEEFNCIELGDLLDKNEELKAGDTVYVADSNIPRPSLLCDADDVLEMMGERASDIAGEYADDYPDVTDEAREELSAFLSAWITKHAMPGFYSVSNSRPYILTDDDFESVNADTSKAVKAEAA